RALDVFLFSLSPSSFIAVTSIHFFFSLLRLPPSSTLFPYTTLFRSLEPPHLDHLDHELDFAILPLVEAQSDHSVRDVFHEAVSRGPRVLVLDLRCEDARGPGGLELLAEGKELLPPFRVVREEHVQKADRVDRDAGGAAPFDEIRELGADAREGRLRVDGLELHDMEFLLLQIPFQIPTERLGVRDDGIDVFLQVG